MRGQTEAAAGTRERILGAAGQVFAEKGFRRATVREIVGRAEANLNAVNYHFGDKKGLYQAVLEGGHSSVDEDDDLRPARDSSLPVEDRLHAFVLAFLRRALSRDRGPHHARLMAMEMAEPTGVLDLVVERFIRPRSQLLMGIIRDVVGDGVPQRKVEQCSLSIVGQCIHLVHGRPIIMRLYPHLSYSQKDIERLARHVTEFCLAALRNLPANDGENA
jgi:AcrR family transcriptional regulator